VGDVPSATNPSLTLDQFLSKNQQFVLQMDSSSSLSQANSFIAAGTVSKIYAIDNNNVIKIRPTSGEFERQAYDIEIRSYERLGHHERIASCKVTEKGLILERGTCLRGMLQSVGKSAISWAMKLQWALEAAEGLAYIHSKGIIHADVGCHNIIVDNAKHAKFIDFAGSGIDGEAPLVCYEWCSFQPGVEIGICTDMFAFGSMLFELETGRVPYNELERTLEMGKLVTVVEGLFSQQKFPPVESLAFGSIISGCWNIKYASIDEVHRDIARCCENYSEVRLNRAVLGAD
jgi:serine/threonine protein kinase